MFNASGAFKMMAGGGGGDLAALCFVPEQSGGLFLWMQIKIVQDEIIPQIGDGNRMQFLSN